MKVILLERVGRYGSIGDEVVVKNGYARNFLLPQGKALRATQANRARFEAERATIEKRNEERRNEAAGIAAGLNGHSVVMVRQAGENGQLYGSVSSRDIAEALVADGFQVLRSQVDLAAPIKTVGIHPIALNLHAEVEINVNVNVARSTDEAERQAKGEDMTVFSFDDDEPEQEEVAAEDAAEADDAEAVVDGEETERQEDA
ncbi:50S ribosomal protein L9 [Mariluticola halotolerans]|uniref:50S ribosomal protein L9 n=1 Tax=Mariluticola halotolerans TaxID=2909283 RepID=UPI0026E20E4F|nr:50S ribosomal protein L9 [Mariluticola halotolerans]UJQ95173.1 50S ribosomal protein L9 [Mariluticola halotolerans]